MYFGGGGDHGFPLYVKSIVVNNSGPMVPAWRWFSTYRCDPLLRVLVACPLAPLCLALVTERYLWSVRPLTSRFSFCVFVLAASCAHVH